MATANLKKLTLIGLSRERNKILKVLHRLNCVEISSVKGIDKTKDFSDDVTKDKLATKIAKINFTFAFLKDMRIEAIKLRDRYKKLTEGKAPEISEPNETITSLVKYEPPKKPIMLGLPGVEYNVFDNIIKKEEQLFEVIEKIEEYNSKLVDIKSDMIRIITLKEQLTPYLSINAKFSDFSDTKNATIMLGLIPNNKLSVIEDIKDAFSDAVIEIYSYTKVSAIVTIADISKKEELLNRLIEADYIETNYQYDMTAQEKYNEIDEKYQELDKLRENIINDTLAYEQFVKDLEVLYDYYSLELKKADADSHFKFTDSTFVMEGWFPEDSEDYILDIINKDFTVYINTRKPLSDEVTPTLNKNNKLVSPYEEITNMYSVPSPREIDPNPFVAIFYFLFFGIMVSDAGYGLILAIGAYLLYRFSAQRKGEGKLVLVILMGGISTFLWGVMFGGWFGITWKPLMFNPLDNPLAMLGLSLGLGIIQILFGMGIKAVSLFRQKKYLDAICNIFGWYGVFLGIGFVALAMVPNLEFLSTVGWVIVIIGFIGVFIGGGLGKKGIGGKLGGGFGNLYNITSFISDILSYSRLFGLGLATGVVGMVINQLALVAVDLIPYVGYVIAIPILIGGHIFNIGINTLGAYVHNSRLQYIEFFNQFYTGGGHQFVPFGSNTKYVYINK